MEPITIEALGTTAGAVLIAGTVVAFVGIFTNMSAYAKRTLSAVVGAASVVGATFLFNDEFSDMALIIVAILNGMIAGLAASKVYEVAQVGLNHEISPES